jgi:CheY-like chemotaxis protein
LVVDDAPLIVRMTTMLLTRKGHTVHQAVNGAEALDLILEGYQDEKCDAAPGTSPFDVVVMDLQMPIMDGIEAIRRLRAAEQRFKCGLTCSAKCLSPDMEEEEEKYTDLEMGSYNYGGEVSTCIASGIAMGLTPGCTQSSRAAIDMQYHQYVIAVSANSDNETIQEAIKAGADSFVSKPFSYDSFSEAMQRRSL